MRMQIFALVALFAGGLALSACETMSAEECAVANWRELGFQDAAGSGTDRFRERSESCAEKGISADGDQYYVGNREGLYEFCQPSRAFHFARNGGSFNGRCPGELAEQFGYAFADGQRVYAAQQELQNARSEVSRLESERRELDDDIGSHERTIANPQTTEQDRTRLRNELDGLRRRRRDINDDIRVAQARIPPAERAVSDLRYRIGNRWGSWN